MNSRERVQTALDHQEPDRVPIDLGGSVVSSISITTYAALRDHLGLPHQEVRIFDIVQQIAIVDDDVLDVFGVDVIPVFADTPAAYLPVVVDEGERGKSFKDDFGATLRRPLGGFYYDWQEFPLPEPSIEALRKMPWPNPADPAHYRGLRAKVERLRAGTDRALFGIAPCAHDLLNQLFRVRGMSEGLMDLVANPDFAEAFLDRMAGMIITATEHFLDEVGDLIDIHFAIADDLTGQAGPLISPAIYRRLVKPRSAQIIQAIKARTKAKVFCHGCGAMTEFLPDLIDIGVEIFNPVQVSATGMDTAALKKKFGKNLAFWGGGCDTQHVLNSAPPEQVREEVRRRIRDLAPGGGYVFNPVHNIQAQIDPANVAAMYEEAQACGKYPIAK